jgi:hypothetical protein
VAASDNLIAWEGFFGSGPGTNVVASHGDDWALWMTVDGLEE